MTDPRIPQAIYGATNRPLRIAGVEIPCYVLDDGRRVLSHTGTLKALGLSMGGTPRYRPGANRLARFVEGRTLRAFASDELIEAVNNPIAFRTSASGVVGQAYEATILADICDLVLRAREAGALLAVQHHVAVQAEVLVRAFARVGIIALVDEATGYQEVRDRNELHRILEAYIAAELRPWSKVFPDDFYREMFRLRGWQYSPLSVKRPGVIGHLTNKLVYEKLPPGVLAELKAKNPSVDGRRRRKHHQFLTEDIGHPHLSRHLASVITLMRVSPNWVKFSRLFERAFPDPNRQEPLFEIAEDDD